MNAHDPHEVSVRLDRLERENRRLRRAGIALGVLGGALALMSFAGAPMCKTIWAERFVLQDNASRSRLTLNAYGTDQPSITFSDSRGKAIASLALSDDGKLQVEIVEEGRSKPARFALTEDGQLALAKPAADAKADGAAKKPAAGGVN